MQAVWGAGRNLRRSPRRASTPRRSARARRISRGVPVGGGRDRRRHHHRRTLTPLIPLAARAGPGNPHVPAHTGRRRQPGRRGGRKALRGWRIGALIDALTLITLVEGHVIVGVADVHVPRHRVVNVVLSQVEQGIAWAPAIWTPTHMVDHCGGPTIIVGSGDTCTQTGHCQSAAHQHRRCPRCG